MDFLNRVSCDMAVKIFTYLEDPLDLARASSVSRSWRNFVIANGLFKILCFRMFPQLSKVDHVAESSDSSNKEHEEAGPSDFRKMETLKEHRVYMYLARTCTLFPLKDCISEALLASSTDRFPDESVYNTLELRDRIGWRYSYWSSGGQSNPEVPETLLYKLFGDVCVITEIKVQPFQAYYQTGEPIYSAKYVRFRMGHHKSQTGNQVDESGRMSFIDKFAWTYTSQEFPMAHENRLQRFMLPDPVLCIGGYLLIEFLGRIQRQESDDLFYICVAHVQAVGRSLSGAFGIEILENSDKLVLKALSYSCS